MKKMYWKWLLCLALVCQAAMAGSNKKEVPLNISFHLEARDAGSKRLSIEVDTKIIGKRYIQKSPMITTSDIIAYHPFVSPHPGEEYGATLQLDKDAAIRLRTLSAANKGAYIVAVINGRVVDMLKIDRAVDGRVITIWRGIPGAFFNVANQRIPKIGETKKEWKARLKKEKQAAKRKAGR